MGMKISTKYYSSSQNSVTASLSSVFLYLLYDFKQLLTITIKSENSRGGKTQGTIVQKALAAVFLLLSFSDHVVITEDN